MSNFDDFNEDNTTSNSRSNSTASQRPSGQQQTYAQKQTGVNNPLSRLQSKAGVTASGNRASGSTLEVVETLKKVKARVDNIPNQLAVSIVPIEHPRLKIAAVALCSKIGQHVSYGIMLLEAFAKPLVNRQENIQYGRTIEKDLTTAHYFDIDMQTIVEEKIRASDTSFHNLTITPVSQPTVPRDVDLKNEDKLSVFFDTIYGAINVSAKVVNGQPTSDFTAADFIDPELALVATYDVTPGATNLDVSGLPMSTDFTIGLQVRPANKKIAEQSLHDSADALPLAVIAGYVDILRVGQAQIKQPPYGQGSATVPGYTPVFVLTSNTIINNGSLGNDTLLSQLLGLGILVPFLADKKWVSVYEPVLGDGDKKPSVGILGLEHNPYPNMQVKLEEVPIIPGYEGIVGQSNKLTALEFVQRYFTDDIIVALDVIYGSPLEWLQSIFASATPGSQAEKIIINELDSFSNGIFGNIWRDKNQSIMSHDKTILHSGYVPNNYSTLSDLRSINYLTMLQHTGGDNSLFGPFAKGFWPGSSDNVAVDEKRKYLQQAFPAARITGMITRNFFNNEFLKSITEMLEACKIHIVTEGLHENVNGSAQYTGLNNQYFKSFNNSLAFAAQSRGNNNNNGGNASFGFAGGIGARTY